MSGFYPDKPTHMHFRPPPCDKVCWEWVKADVGGWSYTHSINHCGHNFDPQARMWRWVNR